MKLLVTATKGTLNLRWRALLPLLPIGRAIKFILLEISETALSTPLWLSFWKIINLLFVRAYRLTIAFFNLTLVGYPIWIVNRWFRSKKIAVFLRLIPLFLLPNTVYRRWTQAIGLIIDFNTEFSVSVNKHPFSFFNSWFHAWLLH